MDCRNNQGIAAEAVDGSAGAQAGTESGPVAVATTVDMLCDEYGRVWPGQGRPSDEQDYRDRVRRHGQSALCLSGGGVRSASFALGVLQALSRKGLLIRFNYLSTVSGGGYIAGWLQRWISEKGNRADVVMAALAADCEPPEVKALRENSNFITPRVGLASNDTWTAIAISLRNIIVNWLLFAPLFLLITIFPNILGSLVEWVGRGGGTATYLGRVSLAGGAVCAAVAAWSTCRGLPSYREQSMRVANAGDRWLKHRIVWWLSAWAVFGTVSLAGELLPPDERVSSLFGWEGAAFAVASTAGMASGLLASGLTLPGAAEDRKRYRATFVGDLPLWASAMAVMAVMVLIGANLFDWMRKLKVGKLSVEDGVLLTISVPVVLLLAHLLSGFVVSAFRRKRVDAVKADADGEWLARLSAVKIKTMLVWLLVTFAALLLAKLLSLAMPGRPLSLTSLVALGSGTIAALGGKSRRSGNGAAASGGAAMVKYLPMKTIILIAGFVFAVALFTVFATFEQFLSRLLSGCLKPAMARVAGWLPEGPLEPFEPTVAAHLLLFLALAGLIFLFGRYIPVNRFSLNGFYRNRLARAFLGAARPGRKPDYFTGFDPQDNFDLHRLAPCDDKGGPVLYPVVNVALNVTASEKLAWQERKAEPFIFSPLYCGSAMLAPEGTEPPARPGAFVSALNYCGSEPGMNMPDRGISLAMAMSISGAAASPNMGYHSSPAIAFLMTLSNVRLGAWLPNPARAVTLGARVYRSNPINSVTALLRELSGSTNDKDRDIYLSDGGHFDNLGLYEMVRRRCRYIVLSDAAADPDCTFTDLGNAVRKVKIDMDVEIRFEELQISSRNKPINPQYAWALGTIVYPDSLDAEGMPDPNKVGHLLYIKPSFFGVLPVDVRSYASGNEGFPHESTVDQFFSESQFESYRNLGFWFVRTLGGEGRHQTIKEFFDAIEAEHRKEKARHKEDGGGMRGSLKTWLGIGSA